MDQRHVALVESFDRAPHYRAVPDPKVPPGHEAVEVLAVGIHQVTRSVAAGRHYTSGDTMPFVAGVDAVVRRADGALAYVIVPDGGTMADRIVVDPQRLCPVPNGADPAALAATMNPAMSSWMVLRERLAFTPGDDVLVVGATGSAGSTAVAVARLLGAGRVVAAGRDQRRLAGLLEQGADEVVRLEPDEEATSAALARAAADVDVVLDYVWGQTTELAMGAILRARRDPARTLDWVHIGSVGGPTICLPGAALRSNALRLSGSGFGSVPAQAYARELPRLAAAISDGAFLVRPRTVPMSQVEEAWAHIDAPGERTVLVP